MLVVPMELALLGLVSVGRVPLQRWQVLKEVVGDNEDPFGSSIERHEFGVTSKGFRES